MKEDMKKIFILCLAMILILTWSLTAFANSSIAKKATIKLDISTSKEDREIIQQYKKIGNDTYSKENNNIVMNVTDIRESEDKVLLSGDAVVKMFREPYTFSFKEKELDIKYVKNKKFYTGSFEVVIDDNYNGIVDITAMATFSKTIIGFTLLALEDEDNQSIMLYGDTFKEQIELFNQELEAVEKEAVQEPKMESENFIMAASASAYQHVTNKSNSSLGGVARDKQMLVMNVSKCDPKNFGSGANGFEMIRVFSRSYNAKNISYESPILLAKPNRVKVTFNGDPDKLMSVDSTKPSSGNGALASVFKVFNSVIGNQGNGLIAAVSAIIAQLSISIGDNVSKSGTNATFDIGISDFKCKQY